ncbi:hypothetical protein ColTof4_14058 [Colletotrichum tofieldiae]|uniref:Uncharacterized protein n=1 Tax=Colletotrichum tofieldiae TaxID=708197 RepID=A0A166P7X1_9PEZI|nr:hypothetical protein CT0861_13175 [Colletotrichum tofieldiae]GKT67355.1 hypothetical protein ColTof3_14694 [Colletotrichum tofieldiae]GKT81635.1 hypothetical protein ColTof4_14058 [Colletotrichum tofieldiae]GKT97610.1 hypothetical protein Ct61P_15460 [Colletotrichum tofieldiae]
MDDCPNKTKLLGILTDTVLEQVDFLLDTPNWEAVNDEKEFEESWLNNNNNKSLKSQLVHINKWYTEKREAEVGEEHPTVSAAAPAAPDIWAAHVAPSPSVGRLVGCASSAAQAQPAPPTQKGADCNTRGQETQRVSWDRLAGASAFGQHHVRPGPAAAPLPSPSMRRLHLPLPVAQADRPPRATALAQRPKMLRPDATPAVTPTATDTRPPVHHQAWHLTMSDTAALLEYELDKRAREQVDAKQKYRQVHPNYIRYLAKRRAASLRDRSLERASAALDIAESKTAEQRSEFGARRREYQLAKRAIKKKSVAAAANDDDGMDATRLEERLAESGRRLQEAHVSLVAAARENEAAYGAYTAAGEASQAAVAVEEQAFGVWERTRLAMLGTEFGRMG